MIGTHGKAAEQLLRTTEMLIGEQENVSFIDFVPGGKMPTHYMRSTMRSCPVYQPLTGYYSSLIPGAAARSTQQTVL